MIDLSIITVSYNTKKLLKKCIESVLKKSSGIKYEIIVVDNASTDGSVKAISNISKKTSIKIIKNKNNLGFGAANNKGIQKALGNFILFLNSDTKINDNLLPEITNWLIKHPKVGAVSCALKDEKGDHQGTGGSFPTLLRVFHWMFFIDDLPFADLVIKPFHPYHKMSPFYKGIHNLKKSKKQDWISGTFFLVRRDILNKVGYFDEDYFMYTEEVDLCYRIRKAGWEIWYLPNWSITHLGGASSIHEFPIISEFKGIMTFFKKHKPVWQFEILRFLLKSGAVLRMIVFGIINGKKDVEVYAKAYKTV